MKSCKCGCGQAVKSGRVFVNKEHQLDWMDRGGASEMNALLPVEVRQRGGHTTGVKAVESGRLLEAARKGGARSREIAARFRAKRERRDP
jgi:general stress protein YciG